VTLTDHHRGVMHNGKHDSWEKCATSVECKSDISAVLTVDFFMISGVGNGWLVGSWFGLGTRRNLVVVFDCPDGIMEQLPVKIVLIDSHLGQLLVE